MCSFIDKAASKSFTAYRIAKDISIPQKRKDDKESVIYLTETITMKKALLKTFFLVVVFLRANQAETQDNKQANIETIRVSLLGTGTPQPILERFGPSILVEAGNEILLFDAGRGCLQRLRQLNLFYNKIDALFLTHLHSDHIVGLPDLWLTGWLTSRRGVPLNIVAHHTTPQQASRIFNTIKPKLAVYSHIGNPYGRNEQELIKQTKANYSGPIILGEDLMSFLIGDTISVSTCKKNTTLVFLLATL